MKVCLINPYIDISESVYREMFTILPPIGLGYIAGMLCENGHDVTVIDCTSASPMQAEEMGNGTVRLGLSRDEVLSKVREFGPDIVGISCCYTIHAPQSYEIAEVIKNEYSQDVPVIAGGPHPSVLAAEVLSRPHFDYVAVGEGEGIMCDLCDALEKGGDTTDIAGLLQSDGNGGVLGNPARPRISDLDGMPFPRRDLFPLEGYIERQRTFFRQDINNRVVPKTTILTSRGCPGNCVFCAVRCTWGRRWTARSPENIIEEIESLIREYGVRELDFIDNSMSASRGRMKRICELMIEKRLDLKWATPNGIAIWTLDRDLLKLMKKSGCYKLVFGFETGDPETLDFINKHYDFDEAKEMVKYANRLGIWTVGTFIMGLPYETGRQIENTIDFATGLGLDLALFYCATPYAGTEMYEICKKEGIDTTLKLHSKGFATVHMTADEVEGYRALATVEFMKSLMRKPWKPLEKIRSFDDLRFTSRVVRHSLGMVMGSSEEKKLAKYPNYRR